MSEPQLDHSIDISMRTATTDDLEDVARLYIELKQHHRALAPHAERYQVADEEWQRLAGRWLANPHMATVLAEVDGEVVGFVRFSFVEKPWGLACEVATLVVAEAWRGRGIGKQLMIESERIAARQGARGMRVDVLIENEGGRLFYGREGYGAFAVRYGKPVGD